MDDLRLHLCRGRHVHQNVYCASYMCQTCPAITDDFASFKKEICPCTLAEGVAPPEEVKRRSASPASSSTGLSIAKAARGRIGGPPLQVPCKLEDKAPAIPREAFAGKPKPDKPTSQQQPKPDKPTLPQQPKPDKPTLPQQPKPDKPTSPQQPKPSLPDACFPKSSNVLPSQPSEASRCLRDELEKAEQDLRRLLILKALQAERDRLEKLMTKKQHSFNEAAHCPLIEQYVICARSVGLTLNQVNMM